MRRLILGPDGRPARRDRGLVLPRRGGLCSAFGLTQLAGFGTVAAIPPEVYSVGAADFDGTNDYALRGGGLTGAVDSKKFTFSLYFFADASTGVICEGVDAESDIHFQIEVTGGLLHIFADSASDVSVLNISTGAGSVSTGSWYHAIGSFDMADTAKRHLYLNDVPKLGVAAYVNDTIDWTFSEFSLGAKTDGTEKWNGGLAEFPIWPGVYINLAQTANRRLFSTADSKPVDMGADASTPTGVAALTYFHLDAGSPTENPDNFALNRGTGGDLTVTGAFATHPSSPSD